MNLPLNDLVAQPLLAVLALGAVAYLLSRLTAWAGRALVLVAGIWILVAGVKIAGHAPETFASLGQIDLGPVALGIQFSATYLGSLLAIGAAAFTLLIALYSFRYMAGEYWEGRFYAYLIWALAGSAIVALAGNLLVLRSAGFQLPPHAVGDGRHGMRAEAVLQHVPQVVNIDKSNCIHLFSLNCDRYFVCYRTIV